jgi:hypothetical protein
MRQMNLAMAGSERHRRARCRAAGCLAARSLNEAEHEHPHGGDNQGHPAGLLKATVPKAGAGHDPCPFRLFPSFPAIWITGREPAREAALA